MVIGKIVEKLGNNLTGFYGDKATKLNDIPGFNVILKLSEETRKGLKIKRINNYFVFVYLLVSEKSERFNDKKLYPIELESRLVEKKDESYYICEKDFKNKILTEIKSSKEIYFHPYNKNFYYKNKKRYLSSKELIQYFYNLQFHPNLYIKIKIFVVRTAILKLAKLSSKLLEGILFLVSGEKIAYEYEARFIFTDKLKIDGGLIKPTTSTSVIQIPLLGGYQAPKWVVFSYFLLHLLVFFIFYYLNFKPLLIKTIFKNNFLLICYLVSTFVIYQSLVLNMLKKCIFFLANIYPKIANYPVALD